MKSNISLFHILIVLLHSECYSAELSLTKSRTHAWDIDASSIHAPTLDTSPALSRSSMLQCFERGNMIEIHNKILFEFHLGLPQMYYDIHTTLLHSTVSQVIRHSCHLSSPCISTGVHFQVVSKQYEYRLLLMERPQSGKKAWMDSLCLHCTFSEGLMWKLRDLSTSGRSTE